MVVNARKTNEKDAAYMIAADYGRSWQNSNSDAVMDCGAGAQVLSPIPEGITPV